MKLVSLYTDKWELTLACGLSRVKSHAVVIKLKNNSLTTVFIMGLIFHKSTIVDSDFISRICIPTQLYFYNFFL